MKKLMMFAATMTIVGGAFAACSDPLPTPETTCALVYDVKISVKTTVPKARTETEVIECEDDVTASICYRVTGSRSFKGYLTNCDCDCTAFAGANLILWEPKAEAMITVDTVLDWDVLNLIGKKGEDVEGAFSLDLDGNTYADLYGAGFGKIDRKTGIIKSISGDIVGVIPGPLCVDAECDTTDSVAFPCEEIGDADMTVAFGTWSVKYNKSQSQKLNDLPGYEVPVPNYVNLISVL